MGILSALLAEILSFCEFNFASTVNIFSLEKNDFFSLRAILHCSQENLYISNLFCFNAISCCLLGIFKEDNLRSETLTMVLTLFLSFQAPSHFLHASLRVPPYSLHNDFNFELCASSSGASTSGPIATFPKFFLALQHP